MSDDLHAIRSIMEQDRREKESRRYWREKERQWKHQRDMEQTDWEIRQLRWIGPLFVSIPASFVIFIILCETGVITPW